MNNDDTPCYPFAYGYLEGLLRRMPYDGAPGITINDYDAFCEHVLKLTKEAKQAGIDYNKFKSNEGHH
jgi:hypothetical protein